MICWSPCVASSAASVSATARAESGRPAGSFVSNCMIRSDNPAGTSGLTSRGAGRLIVATARSMVTVFAALKGSWPVHIR